MARPRLTVPAYRHHKQTGRAAVSIYRQDGSRTEIILPGDYGSDESKQEYERLLAQLRAGNGKLSAEKASSDLTIAQHSWQSTSSNTTVGPMERRPERRQTS